MAENDLNRRIIERGSALFAAIADEKPALFNSATWTGRVMEWCLGNTGFKTSLLRFVDVFPVLTSHAQITDHIRQYFGDGQELPPVLARGARMAGMLGSVGGALLARAISANIREMARQFILAERPDELSDRLAALNRAGFAVALDVLGEATLSHAEAEQYLTTYLQLLELLSAEQSRWTTLPGLEEAPPVHLAVKPTAFFPLANPMDFEGSVSGILAPLRILAQQVVRAGAFLCIDMESHRFKGITLEVYRRLRAEFRDYPHIGIALQAYLRDSEDDLAGLLAWAEEQRTPIAVRLVKGAYWDYETVRAQQLGWPVPVRTVKADSDAAFERMAAVILKHHPICHLACASHNIRSIAAVLETARSLRVPESRYEFQMLYGMAEPVRRGIRAEAGRVRLYCPYGELVPGMGYLVRRLLENTANESFLRLTFKDQADVARLLHDPAEHAGQPASVMEAFAEEFRNEPAVDFTRSEVREAFPAAIATARSRSGQIVPLFINGRDVATTDRLASRNPNRPSEILGQVCQAGSAEVEQAVAAAAAAFPAWRAAPAAERAGCLRRVAALVREQIYEQAALQVLEIGKQWDQAHADVAEAIDFLEYYAAEMCRLAVPCAVGVVPGEENRLYREGRGVAVVIAPWNFPLAIACGMVSAALVTGNTVLFKPSGLTGVIGRRLVELFTAAGIPDGVLNFVPGRGSEIGDLLVDHPAVALIAFTGSLEVGQRIVRRAAPLHPGQRQFKRVIAELGGKNAVIIDDDADLDEAVPQVLASAFGFQGQKCSACSRVIVLEAIHDRFVERLVETARTWRLGPAESPAHAMGAVADEAAQRKILEYLAVGREEGRLLYESPVPEGEGYWVPLAIFGGIRPEHRLAREEIFGPVLAVLRAADFDQALAWANAVPFALTGGLFSRSPEHIARAGREFRVGNLYLNRAITGAMVGRQPFGGAGLSGLGTKAGGPEYLAHFMDQRVVTENTMRRGFAPAVS
ncbi:proline dehydrogenase family protein [Trichlorobacter ammonificans]|uniref:L-glutamate gamma-semialdehyde dehydrogenase n=1 Tax=Trichlorobacter ammonificans TaxID=2916410 RepID=A0ABN8HI91_9BACT|nr:proline dehydrogenase family protein [Trichlorobacter ammonificans]CAH2032541.1 Delta-1-pyrroline-5-carboxylate dehydrogenase,Proline dehydrogenase [Trichlorobacter ammonificans]